MKHYSLLFITSILFFASALKAQTSEEIEQHINEYLTAIANKDYGKFRSMMTSECQNNITKEQLIQLLGIAENEKFSNQIVGYEMTSLSEPGLYVDYIYFKLDYISTREIVFNNDASDSFIEKVNNSFKNNGISNTFKYIEEDRKVVITALSAVIMRIDISDEDNPLFAFIPYRPKLRPYLHHFMPEEAIEQIFEE